MQAVLYFIRSEIGSQWSCCGRGGSFDGVVLWEWGVQQYFGLSASAELQSSECPWEENCNSLIWTRHKKLPVVLLHLLWGTYGWNWCVLVHRRLLDRFWLRVASLLESRINPKFLTLSENTISCVPTMTDFGKQWQEDSKGIEKRMASVSSLFSLSWLFHIHAFMLSVHDRRSCVRLCTSFGGVDFWSWVSCAKSWWLTEWFAQPVRQRF